MSQHRKRICKLTDDLQKDYPFIKSTKSDSDVRCQVCNSEFSISHGGRTDISRHITTDKHKLALSASSSNKLTNYFKFKTFDKKDSELTAAEGTFAYHTVVHNQSFKSMDCTSKLIRKSFESKFTCNRTKSEAIIVNVLYNHAVEELNSELQLANYVSIFSDTSNHKDVKLFPVRIMYTYKHHFSLSISFFVHTLRKIWFLLTMHNITMPMVITFLLQI